MYEDGTHYNKLGHKSVALFISKKKLMKLLKRINFFNYII